MPILRALLIASFDISHRKTFTMPGPSAQRWLLKRFSFLGIIQFEGYIMKTVRAYEEVIEFIAAGTRPSSLIAFQPSDTVKERVADLIHREKTTDLSPDESRN